MVEITYSSGGHAHFEFEKGYKDSVGIVIIIVDQHLNQNISLFGNI